MLIAIVGDHNPDYLTHLATDAAFAQMGVHARWVPTPTVGDDPSLLGEYDGVLVAPGSPYVSMEGALAAIRYAREHDLPLLGTCGGFQHVVIEFARNVAGIRGAAHAETNPQASELVCVPLACSLVGQQHPVLIEPGTLAAKLYRVVETVEPFFCGFGLNPSYQGVLEQAGMHFTGFDENREPRVLELPEHSFFLATLFVPQAAHTQTRQHPLLVGFVEACRRRVG